MMAHPSLPAGARRPVRAIETHYAGCRFRSRLEARWAVFLDHLGIAWEYEPEGFETPAGRYLPDFYLPEHCRWIEIKGGSFTKRDRERGAWFAEHCWQKGDGYRLIQGDMPRVAPEHPGMPGRGTISTLTWTMAAWPIELLNEEGMSLPALVEGGTIAIAGTPAQFATAEGQYSPLPPTATARRQDGEHEFRFFRHDGTVGRSELPGGLRVLYPGTALPWLIHPERKMVATSPGEHLDYGGFRDFQVSLWALAAQPEDVNAALTAARSERFGR